MEQTTSLCQLCGALLKRKARRCSSCGSKANRPAATPQPAPAPQHVPPIPSGDVALSEQLRPLQVKKNRMQILFGMIATATILTYIYVMVSESFGFLALGLLGAALGGGCFYKSTLYTKKKKALISTHVIQGMLADNFALTHYAPEETFSEGQLRTSQLRKWNSFNGNDWFKAEYQGIVFTFSDVGLYQQGRHRHKVFKGQWLILTLQKEVPAPLIISQLERRGELGRRARVPIEQKPFGDIFTVLTEMPAIVPQVLTPDFMEFLITIRHSAPNTELHLFLDGNQAHMGLSTDTDLFEPCSDIQNIPALRQRVQGEIDYIKRVLDGFVSLSNDNQSPPLDL